MSRFGIFWFILVIASGMTNFLVKQTVQKLDDQLTHVRHQTVDEQKKIHDLTAEWTFLNQPELLADLNNRYLHLVPVSPKQVQTSIDNIPPRPAPPPAEAAPQIAEAPQARPPTAPVRSPIVPVSATVPVRPAIVPMEAPAPPVRAPVQPTATPAASLDALFAQVAGNH
jgi:hypothetical protein